MASCSKSKNNNGRLLFKPDTPHFFKIFHGSSINLQNLAIPRKFAVFYGDDLPSRVILKAPTGTKWQVEIVRIINGEIWFQNGWREFAEYYSVVVGSMLVFEYEKSTSEFNVIIFDKSTTEINYPFENVDHQEQVPRKPNVVVDEAERDVSVEILPSKVILDEQSQKVKTCATTPNQNGQAKEQRVNNSTFTRKKALSKAEKLKAIRRAISNSRSQNPSFSIVMQPSYVHKSNVLVIPANFARKHLKKNGDAILNVVDGKSWSTMYCSSTSRGKAQTRINKSGWNKFVKDNDLRVGNVCIFELLPEHVDETSIFRVTISKHSDLCTSPGNNNNSKQSKEKQSCSKQPKGSSDSPKRPRLPRTCNIGNENQTRKKIKLESSVETSNREYPGEFSSGNPTFKRVMKASDFFYNNKYFLRVPRSFVKNMEQRSHEVKLQVDDNKLWSVTLNMYPCTGMFGKGWFGFARQNSLEVGDVCTFELINTGKLLIRVCIAWNVLDNEGH